MDVVVIAEVPDAYHAFRTRRVQFHIETTLGDAGDDRIELLAHLVGHELHYLELDGVALGFGRCDFALGGVQG